MEARGGDHLFCPFECDYCSFFRLLGREPFRDDFVDSSLLVYIRRANLDAFWSRRPGTVYGLTNLFAEQVEIGENFRFQMFKPHGPFSRGYESGLREAIGILWRSQRPGRHEAKLKFSAVRKARAMFTDVFGASAAGVEGTLVWRSDKTRFAATEAPTDSAWFVRFMAGFKVRVGERRKQDAAIPVEAVKAMQALHEEEWADAMDSGNALEQRRIAENASFFLLLFCGSLRGFEGPKVGLTDLRRQIVAPGSARARQYTPHIGLPLTGRFKARSQQQQSILIPIAYETASGLQPGVWVERLVQVLADNFHITTGWAFQDSDGGQRRMASFEDDFYEKLLYIHELTPEIFTEGTDILNDFHLARSYRRGATTRATAAGVSSADIDWINRWNIGADQESSGPMRVLYSDRIQLVEVFLRFSSAL